MYAFPPELFTYIFSLACTDDGSTVRALNLVSPYIREIARPFLYQSLAISGAAQIAVLAEKLERTPPHLRHIRHLFLSDREVTREKSTKTCDAASQVSSNPLESRNILRILTFAASTLETLAFASSSPSSSPSLIARLFRLSFPHLHTLSIHGFYPFPSTPKKFPVLTHLHLSGNRSPHGLLQAGNLDEACPALTHLRVSGLSMALAFALELGEALGGGDAALFPAKLPSSIRRVLVQPAPEKVVLGKAGTAQLKEELMMSRLREVAGKLNAVQVELLDRAAEGVGAEDIRRDWLAELSGGAGCWTR